MARRQALLADLFDHASDTVNHENGINVLSSDGSVGFHPRPADWSAAAADAWYGLDDGPLAAVVP